MKMPPFIGANGVNSDAGNFGQIPGNNTAFFSQFQGPASHNGGKPASAISSQHQHFYESQTQSSYYSRKNTHSQSSYTQKLNKAGVGTTVTQTQMDSNVGRPHGGI